MDVNNGRDSMSPFRVFTADLIAFHATPFLEFAIYRLENELNIIKIAFYIHYTYT